LGDYELLDEIARGGMGIVYRARQVSLNRLVAVKVLPGGLFADSAFIKRFRREVEMAASLNHPNIVAVHEVGEHNGQLYFSMDLIEGCSLAELIHENPVPALQAGRMIQTIAEAVAFAHARRLLHRDLKPSNVLLDEFGVPHITDFGLAKRADAAQDLTLTGQILGSPNYMAPEQAEPKLGPASPASDVYSLGAMLYHLLTGLPPFMGETVTQTLRLVVESEPVPPRLLRPGVPRDLETICLKCLEKDPNQRYPSARELADELGRVERHEPIKARPVGPLAKTARWCRRKPALASVSSVVALLLLVVAIGSPIAILRIRGERELSERARQKETISRIRAEKAEREVRQQLYSALKEQAQASVHSGEIGQRLQALAAIRRAAAISNSVELRREALAALALPDLGFERELPAGPDFTLKLLDPDFETVALCHGTGPVEIRRASDWQLQATLPASTNLPAYVGLWSADRHYLAVKRDYPPGGVEADFEVWNLDTKQRVLILERIGTRALSFHPFQHRLIAGEIGGDLITWDLGKAGQTARFKLGGSPTWIDFSRDGDRFAAIECVNTNYNVSIYDATTGERSATHTFSDTVSAMDWHPSGRWVAIADLSGAVYLMDAQTGNVLTLGSHKAQAVNVTFSPDGGYLLSGGWEGEIIGWDVCTQERALTIGRQSWTAQFRSDGHECALTTKSGIELYTFAKPNHREFLEDLGPRLQHAAFSADGHWIAASADQQVGLWDLNGSGPAALVKGVDESRLSFSMDATELFASGSPGNCAHWRLLPGTNETTPSVLVPVEIPARDKISSLSVASNLVVFTGREGSAITTLGDLPTSGYDWLRTDDGLNGVSSDRHWLGIFHPYSPVLSVYRLPGLQPAVTLQNLANISEFVFSPTGDELAVCSQNGVEFWSTNNWTKTRILTNFTSIVFSPGDSTYWLTSDYRNAGLYAATTLSPLLPLPTGILPLALDSSGRRLAVSIDMRHLQVWDLEDVHRKLRELGLGWDADSDQVHVSHR
jgi:WD40 repeat protein